MTPEQAARFARQGATDYVVPAAAEVLLYAGLTAAPGSEVRALVCQALPLLAQDAATAEYYCIPVAAALLRTAAESPKPSEDRLRATQALRWLDRAEDLGELALDVASPGADPLMPFALAVASLQLQCIRHADARERRRLANLLGAVSREAAEIARRRGAKVAA